MADTNVEPDNHETCLTCGYSLRGLPEGDIRCPECGQPHEAIPHDRYCPGCGHNFGRKRQPLFSCGVCGRRSLPNQLLLAPPPPWPQGRLLAIIGIGLTVLILLTAFRTLTLWHLAAGTLLAALGVVIVLSASAGRAAPTAPCDENKTPEPGTDEH